MDAAVAVIEIPLMISAVVEVPAGVFRSPITLLFTLVTPETMLIPKTLPPAFVAVRLAILFLLNVIPEPPVWYIPLMLDAPVVVRPVTELPYTFKPLLKDA